MVAGSVAGADQVGRGAAAQQEADGLDEDRLARPGLAGQGGEARDRARPRRLRSPPGCGCEAYAACRRNFHRIIRLTAYSGRATLPCLRCPSGAFRSARRITVEYARHPCPCTPVARGRCTCAWEHIGARTRAAHRTGQPDGPGDLLAVLSIVSWAIILHKTWAYRTPAGTRATFLDVVPQEQQVLGGAGRLPDDSRESARRRLPGRLRRDQRPAAPDRARTGQSSGRAGASNPQEPGSRGPRAPAGRRRSR